MSVPQTMDEFKALGVVTCPHCALMLDATDEEALLKHIFEVHPDIAQKVQLDLFLQSMCDVGILRRV